MLKDVKLGNTNLYIVLSSHSNLSANPFQDIQKIVLERLILVNLRLPP